MEPASTKEWENLNESANGTNGTLKSVDQKLRFLYPAGRTVPPLSLFGSGIDTGKGVDGLLFQEINSRTKNSTAKQKRYPNTKTSTKANGPLQKLFIEHTLPHTPNEQKVFSSFVFFNSDLYKRVTREEHNVLQDYLKKKREKKRKQTT